jgi:hypothetical protein
MRMRHVLILASSLFVGVPAVVALADYDYLDALGIHHTVFSFACQTTKLCTSFALVDSTGTEKATAANPVRTDPVGTTSQPVTIIQGDPCAFQTKSNFPLASAAGNTQVVAGVFTKKVYICSILIIPQAATTINFIEGTGASCTTANEQPLIGSTTPVNGMALAVNGGFAHGNGGATIAATSIAANGVCILQSGTAALAGNVEYVQQ